MSHKVVYLGPEGTFTHEAALTFFPDQTLISQPCIEDIFSHVEQGHAQFGVLPIENSTEGVVTHSLDCLMKSPLTITGEIELSVHHHLYQAPEAKAIKRIYSHPQALAQCKHYLQDHFPKVDFVHCMSTIQAMSKMTEDPEGAAIGSERAEGYFKLKPVAKEIQDHTNNTTRFLAISTKPVDTDKPCKTSLMLALNDKPGTLVHLLNPFALLGINLTKIESRPVPQKTWHHVFFIDVLGHHQDKKVQLALEILDTIGVTVKLLGSYPCCSAQILD